MSPGDERVEKSLVGVAKRFGGDFKVERVTRWRDAVRQWKEAGGQVVHLTMYGMPLEEGLAKVDASKPLMVAVGAEKVPAEMYDLADLNVAVGNQPHSEVAALAVFLDRVAKGAWAAKRFDGSLEVVPRARGKEMRVRT
jgi:tRNA (cytidine56-2'-O)-methyltransferase